jgi:hypothetical protein
MDEMLNRADVRGSAARRATCGPGHRKRRLRGVLKALNRLSDEGIVAVVRDSVACRPSNL